MRGDQYTIVTIKKHGTSMGAAIALVVLALVIPSAAANGGPDLAFQQQTRASSARGRRYSAAKAVDGSPFTGWRSEHHSTLLSEWVEVDLGRAASVDRVVLQWDQYH
jgi:hypothetical protein